MLIFDKDSTPTILHNVATPVPTTDMWVLDFLISDFTLTPLSFLEETVGPTMELMIGGFQFNMPASWNVLVCDEETMQLDVAEMSSIAGKEFRALVYGPDMAFPGTLPIQVTNYFTSAVNVGPSLAKHQMLCHPIAPDMWVNVSPSDSYNKYLKGKVAGDFI